MIFAFSLALASIDVQQALTLGEPSQVQVSDSSGARLSGQTVRVFYRHGLHGELERAVGITDEQGVVLFTPEHSGVVVLTSANQKRRTHVGDASTTIPMLLLGFLVFVSGLSFAISARKP